MASLKELMKEADEFGIDYTEMSKQELEDAVKATREENVEADNDVQETVGETTGDGDKDDAQDVKPTKAKKAPKKKASKKKAPKKAEAKAVPQATKNDNPFREGSESYKIADWIMSINNPSKVIQKIADDKDINLGGRTKVEERLEYARIRFYDVRYYLQRKLADKA